MQIKFYLFIISIFFIYSCNEIHTIEKKSLQFNSIKGKSSSSDTISNSLQQVDCLSIQIIECLESVLKSNLLSENWTKDINTLIAFFSNWTSVEILELGPKAVDFFQESIERINHIITTYSRESDYNIISPDLNKKFSPLYNNSEECELKNEESEIKTLLTLSEKCELSNEESEIKTLLTLARDHIQKMLDLYNQYKETVRNNIEAEIKDLLACNAPIYEDLKEETINMLDKIEESTPTYSTSNITKQKVEEWILEVEAFKKSIYREICYMIDFIKGILSSNNLTSEDLQQLKENLDAKKNFISKNEFLNFKYIEFFNNEFQILYDIIRFKESELQQINSIKYKENIRKKLEKAKENVEKAKGKTQKAKEKNDRRKTTLNQIITNANKIIVEAIEAKLEATEAEVIAQEQRLNYIKIRSAKLEATEAEVIAQEQRLNYIKSAELEAIEARKKAKEKATEAIEARKEATEAIQARKEAIEVKKKAKEKATEARKKLKKRLKILQTS